MIGMSVGVSLERTGVRYTSASTKVSHAHGNTASGRDFETANVLSAISRRHRACEHLVGEALAGNLRLRTYI